MYIIYKCNKSENRLMIPIRFDSAESHKTNNYNSVISKFIWVSVRIAALATSSFASYALLSLSELVCVNGDWRCDVT